MFLSPTGNNIKNAVVKHKWQFCTRRENTFSEFGPSRGERVHKYYAYCNPVQSLLIYVVFPKVKIICFCNQCTFVRQEQSSHNAYGISERDNISSRENRATKHYWMKTQLGRSNRWQKHSIWSNPPLHSRIRKDLEGRKMSST